MNYNYYYKL